MSNGGNGLLPFLTLALMGLSSLLYDIGNYFHADLPSVQSEEVNKTLIS